MLHMVLLQPALSMHGILALDALLVAQAMGKSCITVMLHPHLCIHRVLQL